MSFDLFFNIFINCQIKNNKPDLDGSIALAKMTHPGDEKAIEVIKTLHADCGSITDADRCELAGKVMVCSNESLIKQGIDPKKLP